MLLTSRDHIFRGLVVARVARVGFGVCAVERGTVLCRTYLRSDGNRIPGGS